jgi:hypothetical protein
MAEGDRTRVEKREIERETGSAKGKERGGERNETLSQAGLHLQHCHRLLELFD